MLMVSFALDLNSDGKVTDNESIMPPKPLGLDCLFSHIKDSGAYRSHTWIDPGEPDPGTAEITELRVEEQSPLRAVVLVRAILKHKLLASTIPEKNRPPAGTPVTLRLHFYAGSSLVRLQHTFLFAGDVNYDFLRDLSVAIPLPSEAGNIARSLDGDRTEELPRVGVRFGVLQEGPDSAMAWLYRGGREAMIGDRAAKATGWLDVAGPRWGLSVALPRMREMFPKRSAWTTSL